MPATQIERPLGVKTPLGDDALLLDSFVGSENVSEPFHFQLRVLSPDPNVDMEALLTKPVVLSLHLDEDTERYIHGNISSMKLLEYGSDGMAAYRVEVVPWLWFLGLFHDCRIFQNKNALEIVEKVFRDRGFTDYVDRTRGTYRTREYCVQYRETDLNFVSRLLEEEGIFYFFEQSKDKHILVLGDSPSAFVACPNQPIARFMPSEGGRLDEDTVITLEAEYRVQPGTASHTDYDFKKPHVSLFATLAGREKGEIYDYPGRYSTRNEGEHYSRIRLEELEVPIATLRGESNCLGFECGYKFTLADHYRESLNTDFTLLRLEHHARNTSYRSGDVDPFDYRNRFEAIPHDVPFRPRRRARKPVVEGPQTAVVVGKSGEEIWTDQYGRVKVQFFWDREGKADENSSCWIRVAQGWAGKKWGSIFTPRIGQEVVVGFLEGDPDRPLIIGSVYNADQMPPYELPGEQTKSTTKSMSSKGGGGFNEFRFEDKKGDEEVFLNAEKDLQIRVKNDRHETVERDRHLTVTRDKFENTSRDSHADITRDRIEKIGRDHHCEVTGKEAIKVGGSRSIKVIGDVIEEFTGNQSTQVTQNITLKGMQVVIEAAMGLTLKVGGNFITIDPSGVAVMGTLIQLNSGGAALSGSPGSLVSPLSPTAAVEAVKAEAGAVTSVAPGESTTPASMALLHLSPAANAPTHNPNDPDSKQKKHWIEIELLDEIDNPVSGEAFKIILPDGSTVADGTLDDKGFARVDNLDPGVCKVTFPNLDGRAWDKVAEAGARGTD